jgi:hypothetical protein
MMNEDDVLRIAGELWENDYDYGLSKDDTIDFASRLQALWEAELAKQEPAKYEFQGTDGKWHSFIDDEHFRNTAADGSWPIRKLYTRPAPIPSTHALVPIMTEYDGYVAPEDGGAAQYYIDGWNDCREAMLAAAQGEK